MKKHFLRILILIIAVSGVFYLSGGWDKLFNPSTVRAFPGDLLVEFGVPPGTPIFSVNNMKPGDTETHSVTVKNDGTVARYIAVKGVRTNGVGSSPLIESGLNFSIVEGAASLYSDKLVNFFSAKTNDFQLNIINPGQERTYTFNVEFPTSADNGFQAKSVVFDLTFGVITGDNVVINEIFYNVDDKHGLKAPKENDEIDEEKEDKKTGKKDHNKKPTRYKFQWIEIYNPTEKEISLKNWKIVNNSGTIVINANKRIKPGSFALISKDSSLWRFWKNHHAGEKIEVGRKFGDGLDVAGDHLYLTNSKGQIIDKTSWGSDSSGFTPPGTNSTVATGHSTERLVPSFDTDSSSDWTDRFPPTPGN